MALGWSLGHWATFSWMGRQFLQFPDDVLRLHEALWQLRPDVIVETGVYDGGSTLFFASLCRRVISIEVCLRPGVRDAIADRAILIEADSAAPATAEQARRLIRPSDRVCVFLDSDHSAAHVRVEMESFAPLVSSGCYLIVADSNLADLAATPQGSPRWRDDNPAAAVDDFLAIHAEFRRERPRPLFPGGDFLELSYFPHTWLRRE